jgi:hypothetical protein
MKKNSIEESEKLNLFSVPLNSFSNIANSLILNSKKMLQKSTS